MDTPQAKVSNVRRGPAKPPASDELQSGAVMTNASGNRFVIDSKGRRLTLRELTLLNEQDLLMAMGPEASSNAMVLGRTLMAAQVADIDGDAVEIPLSNRQYRAMLEHVGKEGLAAVMAAAQAESAADRESEIETAKN